MKKSSAQQIDHTTWRDASTVRACELTEAELAQMAGGAGDKPTPILLSEAELSQLVGGIGDTGIGDTSGDSEESGKATPILW